MQPLKITLSQAGLTVTEGIFTFIIEGDLTFATINKKTVRAIDFKGKQEVVIDLSAVSASDSAGLALLIEWIKLSNAYQTNLVFKQMPSQLLTLAQLTGFDQVSHFSTST